MLYPYLAMCPVITACQCISKHVNATLKLEAIRISQQAMTSDDNLQVIKAAHVELEAENQPTEHASVACVACIAFTGSCRYMAITANVEVFLEVRQLFQ